MAAETDPKTPFETILQPDTPDAPGRPAAEPGIDAFVQQLKETADKLAKDRASRGDAKLLATALKELRYCFKVFAAYRGRRKVTIFGSARTRADHPAYQAAVAFGKRMADAGYMVITGAASGIMEAGHVGAGRENSFGVNIILPFEQGANSVILDDPKLMNMRYFFGRKLVFIKESDAIALFPGGFGTQDELFETLTLIQTGKSHIFPVVLVDEPGGDYWKRWEAFVDECLLRRGYIAPQDKALYTITDSVEAAAAEVTTFYRVYHSMRYVKGDLVLRLQRPLGERALDELRWEFKDILTGGTFEQTVALPQEANEPAVADLPRLKFRFDRLNHGRLRQLIDFVNRSE
jgi:uncharacterized protein (TIGR00730 family)